MFIVLSPEYVVPSGASCVVCHAPPFPSISHELEKNYELFVRIQQRELRGDAVAYPQRLGDKVVVVVLLLLLTSVKFLNIFDGQDEFGKRCQRVLVKKRCCVRKVIQTSETSNSEGSGVPLDVVLKTVVHLCPH